MKLLTTVAKNLKLLFRSRESAYTIIFGPLLIILIVSFAFMGTDEYAVKVGVHAEEHNALTERTVETLNARGYLVSVYPDNSTCADSVRQGVTHACMSFSTAELGTETVPVTFYLDMSRINLVYQVLDDLSTEIGMQEDEIRQQLSSNTLVRMHTAAQLVEESLNRTLRVTERLDAVVRQLEQSSTALSSIPTEAANVTDLRLLKGYQQGLAQNVKEVRDEALESFDEAAQLIRDLRGECGECPEGIDEDVDAVLQALDEAESAILQVSDDLTDQQLEEAQLLLLFAIDDVERIKGTIENASLAGDEIHEGFELAASAAGESRGDLREVNTRLAYTAEFLRGERTSPEVFSSPISTSVVSVTASEDSLSFAYPYLLVLVIMFIGMLLSSTLIVSDKTSQAAFRNFTTPTSDLYHVTMAFLTAFCILFAEVVVILLASSLFVAQPLLLNPGTTFLLACVAIAIFTFIGMIIGYLSRTQEAAMITSISLGSVLLFVSNLVIPVEGMARLAQLIGRFNPYIVLSELLKKSMLYGVSMGQIVRELLALGAVIALLVVLTVIVQRHLRRKYFRQAQVVARHVPRPLSVIGMTVHNEADLMDALDRMTRQDFEALPPDLVPVWVERELRNRRLARQLRGKSKERMILKLDHYLERHGKRIKR